MKQLSILFAWIALLTLAGTYRNAYSQLPQANLLASESQQPTKPAHLTFFQERDRLRILEASYPVGDFVFNDSQTLRPYFCNLRTPQGVQVTRNHPPIEGRDATDHFNMHPGVWLAFGQISGNDFWRNKASIKHQEFTEPPLVTENALRFATSSTLISQEGNSLGSMINRIAYQVTALGNLIIWESELIAGQPGLQFGDQEEMGLGIRVHSAITEKNGGLIQSSSGMQTAKTTWGQAADWCDYSGMIHGKRVGITLLAAPTNFRQSWWHNRDYGLMVANPFGRAAMKQGAPSVVVVGAGESLTLRYAVMLHDAPEYNPSQAYQFVKRQFDAPKN